MAGKKRANNPIGQVVRCLRLSGIIFILLPLCILPGLAACSGAAKTPFPEVTIFYEEGAQFELISPGGKRVMIDIASPNVLSSPPTEKDILLTTHSHSDHLNVQFADSFPGQQLRIEKGEIKLSDVSITSIQGSHNSTPPPEEGSNYIFIVDMGGMRFVHFGDLGQDSLTQDQLNAIGKVDVAFMQFANSFSSMTASNKKGFNLMDQVKPRLILPTHIDAEATQLAVQKWAGFYWDQKSLKLSVDDLGSETRFLFLGEFAKGSGKIYNVPQWGSQGESP
jgi:L-ascorbate metabolism protein UlaG (beta-lactamase superfamily)